MQGRLQGRERVSDWLGPLEPTPFLDWWVCLMGWLSEGKKNPGQKWEEKKKKREMVGNGPGI